MKAEEFFGLLIPVTYGVFLLIERMWPQRQFPARRGWGWLGLAFLILLGTISTMVPLMIPEEWLAAHRLFDLTGLGVVAGAIVGFIVLSFVNFLWHRSSHHVPFMWRTFHQIHHSPQRVDIAGSVLFHPLEMIVFTLLGVFVTTLLLGLDPVAAAATGYIGAFYGMFQHLNVRTPVWLGYVIQRPEAHCLHHQRGVHRYNYADLPWWDMLFGTYRNPAAWQEEAGFEKAESARFGAMLLMKDVNESAYGRGSLGTSPEMKTAPEQARFT